MEFNIFLLLAKLFNKILFFEIFGFPILALCLILPGIYFSLRLKFPNIRFFKHALDVLKGKFYSDDNPGLLTPKQSFFMVISSNVGLGTISGTSIAIMLAGPGSLIWMAVAAFLSSNVIFAETILSTKYRKVCEKKGTVEAGPSRYLRFGLMEIGHKKCGFILSIMYSFLTIIGIISAGAIFQTYELTNILTKYTIFSNYRFPIIIIIAALILSVIVGGTKRCSNILNKLAPIVTLTLLVMILITIILNITKIPHALMIIIKDAFAIESVVAGFIGTLVMGIRRSGMSNEAGLGTSSITHATVKTKYPTQQATVATLNPCIAIIGFCFLIGLVIVISGVYLEPNAGNGVLLTSDAFGKTLSIFPHILTFVITIIAMSVIINSYFYASNIWLHLFGHKSRYYLYAIYTCAILAANFINFDELVMIADNFFLAVAIPNTIGLFMLRNVVKQEMEKYENIMLSK